MNRLLKILTIIPILLIWFFYSFVSATDNSDCWTFGILSYQQDWWTNSFRIVDQVRETENYNFTKFLTLEQQKAIITKNDLNTAILNLKKYCCTIELWWLSQNDKTCKNDKTFFNPNSLDSPYLFDHIFDVIMRRLNWLSGDNNIYTNMTLDDKWSERRNWINEKATSTWGTPPQTIIEKYKNFWEQSPGELWYNIKEKIYPIIGMWNSDFLSYVWWLWNSEDSLSVSNALTKYNERSLYDRYINACALSSYFYTLLNLWPNSEDKNKVIQVISNLSCDNVLQKQIIWENKYTSLVSQNSSNLFSSNYINWYTEYLSKRQTILEDLWTKSKDRRLDNIRAIPCLQRKCTK